MIFVWMNRAWLHAVGADPISGTAVLEYGRDRDIAAGWRDLVTPCVSLPTQTPVNLGCMPDGINSAQDDDAPNYFEDEEMGIISLYFASTRPEGRPVGSPLGSEDIYVSILGDDGSFGPARPRSGTEQHI
jgi:hypothetical protein